MKKKTAKTAARKPASGKTEASTPAKLAGVKRKLLEMRDDLIKTVRTQQLEESAEQDTGDDADKASQSIEKELLFELSDNERMTLDHIEAALRKIDKGTYGSCESCRKPIPKPRLDALPFARYCITCQSSAESVPELAEAAADFRGIGEETGRES
ncbi:MAG: TraR/DksA family transcriptional regulator [Elusimicrobia bacterium]|nr:TraR/DksA family transcriptional regulator [Elusimicrobiota bacterium]